MSAPLTTAPAKKSLLRKRDTIPELRNGDHLSQPEFHRRYLNMPNVKKAELIEGVVYMPSPVHRKKHGRPHQILGTWIGVYEAETPGLESLSDTTTILDFDNEYQPDLVLRVLPENGGQTRDTPDDFIEGAPELVIEISGSSASKDLNKKKAVYLREGVREYLVWLTLENEFRWFVRKNDEFEPLKPDSAGHLESRFFPGLKLDVEAALGFDSKAVLLALDDLRANRDHQRFVSQLRDFSA